MSEWIFVKRMNRKRTLREAGIVNLSITTSMICSSVSSELFFAESCTMKYFGSRRLKAAIFEGSRVSVAENNSFWHDGSVRSSSRVWIWGISGRRLRNAGANASGVDSVLCLSFSSRLAVSGFGRVAASTWANQS